MTSFQHSSPSQAQAEGPPRKSEHHPTPLMTGLVSLAALFAIGALFAIVSGVGSAIVAVVAVFAFFITFRQRKSRNRALTAFGLGIVGTVIATVGLFAMLGDVHTECKNITDESSPQHVTCFQENYSPWRGLVQAVGSK